MDTEDIKQDLKSKGFSDYAIYIMWKYKDGPFDEDRLY